MRVMISYVSYSSLNAEEDWDVAQRDGDSREGRGAEKVCCSRDQCLGVHRHRAEGSGPTQLPAASPSNITTCHWILMHTSLSTLRDVL